MSAAKNTKAAAGRRLSILIADDDRDTVMTLEAILMDEGHVVHTVTNGAFVTEAVRRFKPHVCILDIQMPGKKRLWASARHQRRTWRRSSGTNRTGKWTAKMDQAKTVGFDHFLMKPADPKQLLELFGKSL